MRLMSNSGVDLSAEQQWMLGMWLRDGLSGVGTLTFYDPDSGVYGALGHAVNDEESGARLPYFALRKMKYLSSGPHA